MLTGSSPVLSCERLDRLTYAGLSPTTKRGSPMSDDGDGSGLKGIIIFVLIFGLGNLILYLTTGLVLIPFK